MTPYKLEYKITWDLLCPSLQARFKYLQDYYNVNEKQLSINNAACNSNKGKLDDTAKKIKDLEDYIDNILDGIRKQIDDLSNTGANMPPGTGTGIDYALKNGRYGQLIKLNQQYQKAVPSNEVFAIRVCPSKSVSKLGNPGSNVKNQRVYCPDDQSYHEYRNGRWVQTLPNTGGREVTTTISSAKSDTALQFYRVFFFDNVNKALYYFWNPTTFTRVI